MYLARLSKHKEYIDSVRDEFVEYKKDSQINKLLSEAQNLLDDDPEYAIDLLTQALELDKDNKDALLYRGIAYMRCENAADALSDFNDVLKLDPQLIRAYYNIGRAQNIFMPLIPYINSTCCCYIANIWECIFYILNVFF